MAFLLYLLQINIALSLLYLCYKVLFSQNTFFGLKKAHTHQYRVILHDLPVVRHSRHRPYYSGPSANYTSRSTLQHGRNSPPESLWHIPVDSLSIRRNMLAILVTHVFENSFDNKTAGKWKAPYHRGEPYNRLRRKHTTLFLLPMDISSSFHFAK